MLVKQWWRDDHGREIALALAELQVWHLFPIPLCGVMKHFVAVFFIIGRVIAADDKKGRLKGDDGRIGKFDWQVRPWKSVEIVWVFHLTYSVAIVGLKFCAHQLNGERIRIYKKHCF